MERPDRVLPLEDSTSAAVEPIVSLVVMVRESKNSGV
jgi:hypothetical protein